ncbi:MAG TPA: LamG-like jellyroll fold domain-containing protein [Verrucomicrobiae bacterium]|nr:LamG-like jellyroll fold domain-containing protein [Verrucomicrobiae bacterium]
MMQRPPYLAALATVALLTGAATAIAQTLPANLVLTNITIQGQPRSLALYKRSVRATNLFYLTWSAGTGYQTNTPPQVRTYRGTVVGASNTIVCATIKPGGLLQADGFDYEQGKSYTWQINNVNVSSQLPPGTFGSPPNLGAVAAEPSEESGHALRDIMDSIEPPGADPGALSESNVAALAQLPRSTYMPPSGGMKVMDLGIDLTHYRFVNSFGSNPDAAFVDVEHEVNIYDLLMARDALVSIRESVFVIRQDIFYVPTSGGHQLNLITAEWKSVPLTNLPWAQVHSFATEQGLFGTGGYAWGNVIGKDESSANVEALYHEAGHNWDVGHLVYGRDTMGGNRPNHGPFCIDRLLRKRDESITEGDITSFPGTYPDRLPPYTHVDCASVLTNSFVNINVLTNDWDGNGDALTVIVFSTNTLKGGVVSWVNNGTLRYTPAPNYVGKDIFAYTVQDSTGLKTRDIVHVEVINRNLAVSYSFEETDGKLATDSTGNGHPGKLQGATDFATSTEPGVSGQALRVDSGGVICDNSPLMPADAPVNSDYNYWPFDAETMSRGNFFDPMDESYTVAFWFKADDVSTSRSLLKKEWHTENHVGFSLTMSGSGLTATVREFNGLSNTKTLTWSTALAASRWYHVALQFDRTVNQARLFVDGVQRASAALDAGRFIFQGRQPLLLGEGAGGQVAFDEFRLYTKALSLAEIQALYAIGHIAASGPSPSDGERDVALSRQLTWVAGRATYQHDVFFGTNFAAVAAATTNSPEYVARRTVANFSPGILLPDTTYYWRVDEILGGTNVAAGSVWSFITAPDSIHGGLKLQLTLDARDTLGNITYDRAGPPFNDGTLNNAPTPTAGQVAEGLAFNGANQYVEVPALSLTTDTITLLAWVRRDGVANLNDWAGIIFHRGGSVSGLNVSTLNRLGYHWNDAANTYNFNSGLTLPSDQWVLAALTVETNRAILYLGTTNGVLLSATNNVSHNLSTFDSPIRLANDSTSSSRSFRGGMDEVGIWNRALTRAEIGAILTNGMSGGGIDGPPPAPQPGTYTWTGNTDNSWANAGNWSVGLVPTALNVATFDESSAQNLDTDLGQPFSVSGALITGKLRALGISSAAGNALTVGANGIQVSNSFTALTLAAPVTLNALQTWTVSEFAALTVRSNITSGGNALTLVNDGSATLAGTFAGSGGLIKRGAGTLTMTAGLQSFTGGLAVSNGTFNALGGQWARSFFANVSPRAITVYSNATLETTTHSLGGLGASFYQPMITLNEGARWYLNAEQYLNGGNLSLRGAEVFIAANDLRIQGGTVTINSSSLPTTITGGGSITLYGGTTFNVANGPLATDAIIAIPIGNSGNQSLTKSGAGTLALTEASTFFGPTTVSAGTLALRGGDNRLPQAMSVSISAGAVLDLSNNNQALASLTGSGNVSLGYGTLTLAMTSAQTFSGIISGSPNGAPPASGNTEESPNPGGLTKSGSGKLTLTANQAYTGDTLITSGTLALSGNGGLPGSSNLVVSLGGILDVTAKTGASIGLSAGQTLKGRGTVLGGVSVNNLSTISPGESVGTLVTGAETWAGGGTYLWEANHATTPGNWDTLNINGTLNIAANAGNKFVLQLVSPPGPLPGFNSATSYSWIIATTTGGVQNFDPAKFAVDASGLGVNLSGGAFTVQVSGNNLLLVFTPFVAPRINSSLMLPNGWFTLSGTGGVAQTYVLLTASNLNSPILWSPLQTNTADENGLFIFTDETTTNVLMRFYRLSTP